MPHGLHMPRFMVMFTFCFMMMGEAQMWGQFPKPKIRGQIGLPPHRRPIILVMSNDPTMGLLPYTQHLLTLKGRSMILFGFGFALSFFHPESY